VVRFPLIGSETPGFLAPRAKAKARSDLAAGLQFFRVIFVVRIRYYGKGKKTSKQVWNKRCGDSFRDNLLFWIAMLHASSMKLLD